ncbi:chemotaxis protein CheW [Hydrogenivirga sp. 128-5-R1-1]|uniref:chemotaxis protein CheW n=1 Tax=Hydrogenivirga sp. 128-5-R1-1 TaxID=392423 RepID=UPI00015F186D|nr:chemotaxis protein CheW [Hydrogenivirga sp. 128-5-R1-1]EDP75515.1 Chemotaxis signal transduction protein [Hydrogenivirga sp. 128-5-R1-1]
MLSFTLFRVGDELFAYETAKISETVKVDRVFPVPLAPPHLKGVINLRNRVIPLIDMGVLLWNKPVESDTAIILEINSELVGLLIDRVVGITSVDWGDIKSKEDIEIKDLREDLIRGVFERDGSVVFILELSPVVQKREIKGKKEKRRKTKEGDREGGDKEELSGFVIFPLGGEWYAFPVEEVREIINYPSHVSPIPQSPAYVEGVFLLRGEELVLMSLRGMLGVNSDRPEQRVIILKLGGATVGVAVDDVKEIKWVPKDSILSSEGEERSGILVLDGGERLVYLLSVSDIVDTSEIEGLVEQGEEEGEEEVKDMKSFVRFTVGSIDMAIPIEKVQEVIEVEELTPLPGAPDYVRGMYNLRNSVIVVIDLAQKLGVKAEGDSNRTVVLEEMPVGLVVTKLRGIMKTEEENLQPAEDLAGLEENLLEGIIKTEEGDIVFVLDVDSAVQEDELKLIKEGALKDGAE